MEIPTIPVTHQFCFVFVFFSCFLPRASVYFPAIIQLLLPRSSSLLFNHHFGFLLGNLIIIALFVNSGYSVCNNRRTSTAAGNDDEGFLIRRFMPDETIVSKDFVVQRTESEPKRYRRTRSEEFEPQAIEKIQLRRSETESRREMENLAEDSIGMRRITVEDLSNEEFQLKVEAFIEQQQRFLREESLSTAARNRCSA